jgi:glycopeptide antibiotics resistance protein
MHAAIKEVIEMSWPTIIVLLSVFIIMRFTTYFTGEEKKFVIHHELFNLLFMTYLLVLFRLVTSQDISLLNSTNLIPFREILRYDVGTSEFNRQVIGNIVLFIPFGYFMSHYCKIRGLGTITIVSFLTSFVIETVQHFIGRSFDVDDIILNIVGGILGFLIYIALNAIKNHLPNFLKKDWILNIISIIIIALIVLYIFKYII